MKLIACLLLCFTALFAHAQSVTYSRSNVRTFHSDGLQLVSNIGGYTHLLVTSNEQKTRLDIFNNNLQKIASRNLDIIVPANTLPKITTLNNSYFLLSGNPKSRREHLYKITATGEVTDLTDKYGTLLDSVFTKNPSEVKLEMIDKKLFLISSLYFKQLKKVITIQAEVNEDLQLVKVNRVGYGYHSGESIHEVKLISADHLAVLKTAIDSLNTVYLQLLRINMNTGKMVSASFTSFNYFVRPSLYTSYTDSNIIVYAPVAIETKGQRRIVRMFFTTVHKSFDTLMQPVLHKLNSANNFMLVKTHSYKWLTMPVAKSQVIRTTTTGSRYTANGYNQTLDMAADDRYAIGQNYYFDQLNNNNTALQRSVEFGGTLANNTIPPQSINNQPQASTRGITGPSYIPTVVPAFNLTLYNQHFAQLSDTVYKNDDKKNTINPVEFKIFSSKTNDYLVMKQTLHKAHGMVMFYAGKFNTIEERNLLVNPKYEYLLSKAVKGDDNSILIPFTFRNEAGIVKVAIE